MTRPAQHMQINDVLKYYFTLRTLYLTQTITLNFDRAASTLQPVSHCTFDLLRNRVTAPHRKWCYFCDTTLNIIFNSKHIHEGDDAFTVHHNSKECCFSSLLSYFSFFPFFIYYLLMLSFSRVGHKPRGKNRHYLSTQCCLWSSSAHAASGKTANMDTWLKCFCSQFMCDL